MVSVRSHAFPRALAAALLVLALRSVAPSIAAGVMWDRGLSYRGALAAESPERVQFLLRPNIEF